MSDVSVDIIKNRSGEAPDLPSGANLSGVSTAATLQVTNLNPTHINASGVTTATTFSGSLKSTGTPTLGLGVTINSSGINISGVATAGIVSATTLYGDGSNLTGVAMSIAPISYNPDVNDTLATIDTGIGITFTRRIIAGSGNVTLRLVSAAGTVVENFGVGSSVTINNNTISISPSSNLSIDTLYHISYPSGAFTNTSGDLSYVGTAYTFKVKPNFYQLWAWGNGGDGQLAQNNRTTYSSPIQITGSNWRYSSSYNDTIFGSKTDGTLWAWGNNGNGVLGLSQTTNIKYSSPVQIPGTTWNNLATTVAGDQMAATRTDGTLWIWGGGAFGSSGLNSNVKYSSPVQIPGTTWKQVAISYIWGIATKTDGTLWSWGRNNEGQLGVNDVVDRSSPTQIPGTAWANSINCGSQAFAVRTDGTLWAWGDEDKGVLGQNNTSVKYSSPVQIPGTTWATGNFQLVSGPGRLCGCIKTDGTLWTWGRNAYGQLGVNDNVDRSSPVQVPGTTWSSISYNFSNGVKATKTDGTLWSWGRNDSGRLGLNNTTQYSSPVQIPGTEWTTGARGISARKDA